MFDLDIWTLLGIAAIVCLVISFFIGKNSIWGGLTLGLIICIITGIVNLIIGNGINWALLKKVLIVVVLAGALFELIGRLSKKRNS